MLSVAVGFQMLPSVLKGSKPAIPGEALPVVLSPDAAPAPSRISGDGDMLVVTGVGDPELQIEETGFHPALALVFSAEESQSPALEGAVPTACHGSGVGGSGATLVALLLSHKLSWDTTGISKPGHCSPVKGTKYTLVFSRSTSFQGQIAKFYISVFLKCLYDLCAQQMPSRRRILSCYSNFLW